jgi:hypothetical protein
VERSEAIATTIRCADIEENAKNKRNDRELIPFGVRAELHYNVGKKSFCFITA